MLFNFEQLWKRYAVAYLERRWSGLVGPEKKSPETRHQTRFDCAKLIALCRNLYLKEEGGETSVIYGREIGSVKEGGFT
jgi:hypothetical protein